MLKPEVVADVKRLWATGNWSQRKIAVMAGCSRGSVSNIVSGRRPDYEAIRRDEPVDVGPLVRCPGCGGKQHLPCRVCRDRLATEGRMGKAQRSRIRAADAAIESLAAESSPIAPLSLKPEHQVRYQELRRYTAAQPQEESRGTDPHAARDQGRPQ